jgi:hypothetical protein
MAGEFRGEQGLATAAMQVAAYELDHGLVAVVDRQPDLAARAVQAREGKILH